MDIEVNFGNSCNLNCSYCFVKDFKTDKNICQNYIDSIAKWLNNNRIKIDTFRPVGGEPSLKLYSILKFIDLLDNKPSKMMFVTNGVDLIESVSKIHTLINRVKDITVVCSIDKLGYDENRKLNYDKIMLDLINCKSKYSGIKFSVNRVLSNQSDSDIKIMNILLKEYDISKIDIPITDKFHHNKLGIEHENTSQIKLCNAFCYNGLYFYKDRIYICKLCENVHSKGCIGTLNNTIEEILINKANVMSNPKLNGCIYEKLNKEVSNDS